MAFDAEDQKKPSFDFKLKDAFDRPKECINFFFNLQVKKPNQTKTIAYMELLKDKVQTIFNFWWQKQQDIPGRTVVDFGVVLLLSLFLVAVLNPLLWRTADSQWGHINQSLDYGTIPIMAQFGLLCFCPEIFLCPQLCWFLFNHLSSLAFMLHCFLVASRV